MNLEGFIKAGIHKGNYRMVSSNPSVINAIGTVSNLTEGTGYFMILVCRLTSQSTVLHQKPTNAVVNQLIQQWHY